MTENIKHVYKLDPNCELQFKIESKNKKVILELKSGFAEIFGTELVTNRKYEFLTGSSIAVFTWQGCTVQLEGTSDGTRIVKETPMSIYLNCHTVLERLRQLSEKGDEKGPVTMIVGPCDVGKSTISRLLANYALRMNRRPIYLSLDTGQVDFAIPGTLGALLLDKPASIEQGFSQETAPLVFHFGYDSPQHNETLYRLLITNLADICNDRIKNNQRAKHSGIIINTCGWTKGNGYKALTHAAQAFEVDVILVIDQETLYNDLLRDMPDFVKVVLLPKSNGVVGTSQTQRAEARNSSIRRYFYGNIKSRLYPHKIQLKFEDVAIYKIGAYSSSSSSSSFCKPVGMTSENSRTMLVPLQPFPSMRNHLLSISFANSDQDDVIQSNVAGFLHVEEVNMQMKILTVLSLQPKLMPNSILLFSDIKYWSNS